MPGRVGEKPYKGMHVSMGVDGRRWLISGPASVSASVSDDAMAGD